MSWLEVHRCGLCDGWVAGYGCVEIEDKCPLVACYKLFAMINAE